MRNFIFALALFGAAPASAMSIDDFRKIIDHHCKQPAIRCYPELTSWTTVGFTYEGEGHKSYFWLSKREYEEFERTTAHYWVPQRHTVTATSRPVGRPFIMAEKPYTRLDELETKKFRLNAMRVLCGAGFAGCGYAASKLLGFWPGFIATVTCAGGALACEVVAGNMIEKIDDEIDALESGGHVSGGSSSGSSWVSGPFTPHAMPPLPPLPTGHVTIIDHPYIP